MKRSKNYRSAAESINEENLYSPVEALELAKGGTKAKFDETVEVAMNLGVDPRHADRRFARRVLLSLAVVLALAALDLVAFWLPDRLTLLLALGGAAGGVATSRASSSASSASWASSITNIAGRSTARSCSR